MRTKQMRKVAAAFAGLLFIAGLFSFTAEPSFEPVIIKQECESTNTSFRSGEELVFTIYYNWQFVWIPAGEAKFTVTETEDEYDIEVKGKTFESYDYLFKVNDYFHSKIDKKTLLPKNFVRVIEEGNYTIFDSIAFHQNLSSATTVHGKTRETAQKQVHEFASCMHDLLSVLYFMRNTNVEGYKEGDYLKTNVFFDKEQYPIKVRYMGRDKTKKVKGLGKYKTIRVIPDLVAGNIFDAEDKMNIWVTDDKNKVPLLIESPLKVGTGKAILKSYKGLRNVVTSKL